MIKNLRKLSIGILTLCLVFVFTLINTFNVSATSSIENDTKLSDYVYRVGDLETRELMGGVTLYKERIKSVYNGIDNGDYDINSLNYCLGHNTVQWVDLPKTSEEVKVIVWSEGTEHGWEKSTVRNTAKHYEATHPGWIVVAAVNGDGFQINSTCEPNNIHVQEGDTIQPINSVIPIGWTDDNTPVYGDGRLSSTLYVEVLENDSVVKSLPVTTINNTPSATGITLLTKDMLNNVDLTGFTVMVGKYDVCRQSRDNGKPFVKGELVSVRTDLTVTKPSAVIDKVNVNEFFLVSKDGSLDQLSVGNYVRCQYPLTGSWSNVHNAISGFGDKVDGGDYSSQVLNNYVPTGQGTSNTFAKTTHPRTVVGFKEDGSTVLMVCNGRAEIGNGIYYAQQVYGQGLSYYQLGEVMRLAGCQTAFNLDGGGSSTLIVRNNYGDFDVINTPSDGSERLIGNAILFVMKDPGITLDSDNTTRNDLVFNLGGSLFSDTVTNAKITVEGETKPFENGTVQFSGLKEDTEYVAKVEYSIPSNTDPNKIIDCSYNMYVKTKAFVMPIAGFKFTNVDKNNVTLIRAQSDTSSWFENIKVNFNEENYNMGSAYEFTFENLIQNTNYTATISYEVVEPATGNRYYGSEILYTQTLNFYKPSINTFEIYRQSKNRITFTYEYTDDDNVVSMANLYCNDDAYPLTQKRGTIAVSDLDFDNNEYKFIIKISYNDGTTTLKEIKTEEIIVGTKKEEPVEVKHSITYVLNGGVLNDAPSEYVEGVGLEVLPTPTKEGYIFKGWYVGSEKIESITKDDNTDITLTAEWEEEVKEDPTPTPEPNPTPTPTPEPSESKKGCRKSASYIIILTSMLSCIGILLRKRK